MIEVYDKVREIAEHFNCSITDVELASPITVSYTHLTLPTIYSV